MKAKPKSLALAKFQQAGQLAIAKNKAAKVACFSVAEKTPFFFLDFFGRSYMYIYIIFNNIYIYNYVCIYILYICIYICLLCVCGGKAQVEVMFFQFVSSFLGGRGAPVRHKRFGKSNFAMFRSRMSTEF